MLHARRKYYMLHKTSVFPPNPKTNKNEGELLNFKTKTPPCSKKKKQLAAKKTSHVQPKLSCMLHLYIPFVTLMLHRRIM